MMEIRVQKTLCVNYHRVRIRELINMPMKEDSASHRVFPIVKSMAFYRVGNEITDP